MCIMAAQRPARGRGGLMSYTPSRERNFCLAAHESDSKPAQDGGAGGHAAPPTTAQQNPCGRPGVYLQLIFISASLIIIVPVLADTSLKKYPEVVPNKENEERETCKVDLSHRGVTDQP